MGTIKRVMTIAGSDSGGGAGIQADLKTFCALGVYGTSVVTAITAQNTLGVTAISYVDPALVRAQMDAVLSDIGTDVVKIGMLGQVITVQVVADTLRQFGSPRAILDPVMVAKGGDLLLDQDAKEVLVRELFPIVDLVTPNLPEASAFLGRTILSRAEMRDAAIALVRLGARSVLIKGGHLSGKQSPDCLASVDGEVTWFEGPRIESQNTHGTGCTLSSAIAAYLARGCSLCEAIDLGRRSLAQALESGAVWRLGHGIGPLDHSALIFPGEAVPKKSR